jgi:hypothetical protein
MGRNAPDRPGDRLFEAQRRTARLELARNRGRVLAAIETFAIINEGIDERAALGRTFHAKLLGNDLIDDPRFAGLEAELASGDEASVLATLDRIASEAGLVRIGGDPTLGYDQTVTFDRKLHRPIGGDLRPGRPVRVVNPGYSIDLDGEQVVVEKAVVEEL